MTGNREVAHDLTQDTFPNPVGCQQKRDGLLIETLS